MNFQRFLKGATILAIILYSFVFTVTAIGAKKIEDFPDLPTGWSREAIINAVNNGLVYGIDGKLMPKADLTRAQLATIVNRSVNATQRADITSFKDAEPNAWFYNDLSKAFFLKNMVGYNNHLDPNRSATREEVFTVLARSLGYTPTTDSGLLSKFTDADKISPWAKESIAIMVQRGYMLASNGKIEPKLIVTREEFVFVINQILNSDTQENLADTSVSCADVNEIAKKTDYFSR